MVPYGNGKHAAEAAEAVGSPMKKGIQNNFGIALGLEFEASSLQLSAKLAMIENLAIEDNNDIAIWAVERLISLG
jgi:hypothetical protein